jgi:hypothetical protein
VPDWRDPEQYRFPPDFHSYRWAWEFLRRNPEYRKDWDALLVRFNFTKDSEVPAGAFPGLPSTEANEKWGLTQGYINPNWDDPPNLEFRLPYGRVRIGNLSDDTKLPQVWAQFSLAYPLKPQLEVLGEGLRGLQKHFQPATLPKRHRGLWPRYLRLLDARAAGAQLKEMAGLLSAELPDAIDERQVSDQLRAAQRLIRPAGYLQIPL